MMLMACERLEVRTLRAQRPQGSALSPRLTAILKVRRPARNLPGKIMRRDLRKIAEDDDAWHTSTLTSGGRSTISSPPTGKQEADAGPTVAQARLPNCAIRRVLPPENARRFGRRGNHRWRPPSRRRQP
jgi:hypothetical protein